MNKEYREQPTRIGCILILLFMCLCAWLSSYIIYLIGSFTYKLFGFE